MKPSDILGDERRSNYDLTKPLIDQVLYTCQERNVNPQAIDQATFTEFAGEVLENDPDAETLYEFFETTDEILLTAWYVFSANRDEFIDGLEPL